VAQVAARFTVTYTIGRGEPRTIDITLRRVTN
jgi:hypothetical protein